MCERLAIVESVYQEKKDCCGCKSCLNVCPTHSIRMILDEYGFEYPSIDRATCVDCGKCRAVCPMLRATGRPVGETFAVILDDEARERSASGGAFYALAKAFLEEGGVVFGCAFDEHLVARHVEIAALSDLWKTQGSKYVQSDMDCHRRVLERLKSGKPVLFSGTPCQVAAIRSFVGASDEGLFTVDFVCHGVPNAALWQDYIDFLGKRHKGKIAWFKFRDKEEGKRYCAKFEVETRSKCRKYRLPSVLSSYYYAFLNGNTFRPSCYACPFARPERPGDVTVCDFWGYRGLAFRGRTDVSAVLIQGTKGRHLFEMARKHLLTEASDFSAVAARNEQLRQPSDRKKFDGRFFRIWKEQGMEGLERNHRREHWKAWLLHLLGRL
jgi:coenzyme F420-reducing hydrogenase beta subunit